MSQLRLGLLGYGRIAELVHARLMTQLPNARLVAVAEADASRRALAEQATGTIGFPSVKALIAAEMADAVVVCLPTPQHASAAESCFDAGLHVYLEKPIATTMDDASRVLAAWERSGKVGMIGLNFRFSPQYAALRELVRAKTLGRIVMVRSVLTSSPRALPEWKSYRVSGGGALLDLATHHIDLLAYVLQDPVVSVQASVSSISTEHDTASLQATLASGALYQGMFSLTAPESHRFEISGEAGTASYDRNLDREVRVVPLKAAHSRARRVARVLDAVHPQALLRGSQPEPSFQLALEAFVAAARAGGNRSAPSSLRYAANCLSVVLAAERSALTGRTERVVPLERSA